MRPFGHLKEPKIFDGFFDDPNSDTEEMSYDMRTFEIIHPEFTNAFDIIYEKETFSKPLHLSDYDFNDDLLEIGSKFWVSLVEDRLPKIKNS